MTPLVQNVTDALSFVIVLLGILAVALFALLITPLQRTGWGAAVATFFGERAILFSFLVALGATLGSLFYSNIAGFQPCLLCWWQRIFLYPQTILLGIALFKKDDGVRRYSLALSGIGALVSLYHTYIQFGGESALPCAATGVNCQTLYFLEYGYVTIPTMALTAYLLIVLLLLFPRKKDY
jgi:disulfide bond formation protein DsbB